MTMPNFLIIGTGRAGTTALWNHLKQHPQIYMSSVKHTRFFALEGKDLDFRGPSPQDERISWARGTYGVTDLKAYRKLFDGVTNETAIGEASHSYLYSPEAPKRIRYYVPDVRLVAILRNPVERAYSHFRRLVQDGREPYANFTQALLEEESRIRDNWWPEFHYVRMGFYGAQLERYFDLFERSQMKIYLYEDFNSNPQHILQDIFRFLDVDDTFIPDTTLRYNAAGIPRKKILHETLLKLSVARPLLEPLLPKKQRQRVLQIASNLKKRNLDKPELSPEVRERLTEVYREDTLKLQQLIQRDLSAWLE